MDLPPTCVMKFTATWCGPCQAIQPFIHEQEEKFEIPVIVIDVDEHPEIAQEYKVASIPHIAFRKNCEIIDIVIGANQKQIEDGFAKLKKKENQIYLPKSKIAEVAKNGKR